MRNLIKRTVCALMLGALVAPIPLAAAQAQSEMLSMRRTSAVGNYLAGVAALDTLDASRAASYFMQAAEQDWDNPVYAGQAFLAYLMAGDIPRAASMAQRVLDLNPRDELARLTLGTVALKQRRYASATQMLARVPDISLVGVTAGIMRAWSHVGEGDLAAANALFDAMGQGGFEEFLVFHRAVLADVGGDRATALALSREAYERDPFVPRIAEAHIRMLANSGDFDAAQEVLDSYAAEGVRHAVVDVLREPVAERRRPGVFVASVQAGAAEMLHGLGTALIRDAADELGVAFLQLAHYLDPEAAVVAMSLSDIFVRAGQYDKADALLSSVPRNSPLYVGALVRLAETQDLRGERETAIARLRNITSLHPDNQEAFGILGDTYRFEERWEEAAEAYTGIIDQLDPPRPRDWRFFYVRAIAYERAGQWERAEPDFFTALELSPDHPDVLNYLGYSWVDQGVNLDEALAMIERAVALDPESGYIIDSLGWAFFKLGRIDEAIEQLEKALQIMPADPEINDHLGDAYWMAGREREAMFQWRIAIHVDERGDVAERAAPKLLHGLDPDAPVGD